MKKKRFYWEKFLKNENEYSYSFLLEVIVYIINSGSAINEWVGRWDRTGVNRVMLGYSGNNNPFGFHTLNLQEIGAWANYRLINLLVRSHYKAIEDFKKELRLKNKRSFLLIPDPDFYDMKKYSRFSEFENKFLNYNPQPDFKEREKAYIKGSPKIKIGTTISIEFDFTFDLDGFYSSSWTEIFERKIDETTSKYLDRCYDFLNKHTLKKEYK